MSDKEMPFALARWLKRQQEEKEQHQADMVKKNVKEDDLYLSMLGDLSKKPLKDREKLMLYRFLEYKGEGKLYTPKQKSVIANMFYTYKEA